MNAQPVGRIVAGCEPFALLRIPSVWLILFPHHRSGRGPLA
ncbi:hypothetical protein ACVWXU_007017 [Streptomyces sp. TE33382]